ncbi:hypothetical protein A3762_10975 [Oleiphilus sp. HI0125]|uniref:hypothetical protein n=2 Tax=Oleiphilus sp. HI0125 TaxID=1822266 RepID=UPI0007C2DB90|nr:hypothetical protein [Oleiphilus sp. HI0125]KZZ56509.1 hypothetical protein A3762_10975 [Oleiphilus sp. HI0125]
MSSKTVRYALLLSSFLTLNACGIAGPGGGGGPTFNKPSTDPARDVVTAAITVEGTARMHQRGFSSNTAPILVDDNIPCGNISVVRLDFDMTEFNVSSSFPDYASVKRAGFGKPDAPGCKLEFETNFEPQIDHVVRVEYQNGDILYAPLRRVESEDQSITVSFGTHLAVERFFDKINSRDELNKHRPCSGVNPDCETQHRAKSRLLSFISDTARIYEYDDLIQPAQEADEVLALLRGESDLMIHIDTAVGEIIREDSPIAKGTVRESYDTVLDPDILNGDIQNRLRPSLIFNSVIFGMGFIEDIDNDSRYNKLLTLSTNLESGDDSQAFPQLINNSFYLDYRYDEVLPNIPMRMSTLRFKTTNVTATTEPSRPENRYSFLTSSDQNESTLVNGTHLSTQGFFLNDRAIAQIVTERNTGGSLLYGYDYNPVYYKLYRVNEQEPNTILTELDFEPPVDYGDSPTWLTGAGYGFASIYDVTQDSATQEFERGDIAEKLRYFSWELHGLRTPETVSEDVITGDYDVIEFGIAMDTNTLDTARKPVQVTAQLKEWSLSGRSVSESQPNSPSDFYRTWELARDKDMVFSAAQQQTGGLSGSRSLDLYEGGSGTLDTFGLLTLGTGSDRAIGHMTENGQHLAFTTRDTSNNSASRSLIIATKARNDDITLSSTPLDFTLSGNYFYMDADKHRLANVNESRLSLEEDGSGCRATLGLQSVSVEHDLSSSGTLSMPVISSTTNYNSASCSLDKGQVEIVFNIGGDALTLRGFAAREDGATGKTVKLINLLWLQDNALGLVFAQLDQDLSPTFDN